MDRGDPILDAGPGRPMPPRYEEHPRMPPRGPPFVDSRGPPGRHDRPRFDADDPRMGRHNNDFRGHPMELDPHPHERSLSMGPMEPPVRFDGPPRRDGPSDPIFARGRPVDNIPAPRTPPRQEPGLFFFLLYFLPPCKKRYSTFFHCYLTGHKIAPDKGDNTTTFSTMSTGTEKFATSKIGVQ